MFGQQGQGTNVPTYTPQGSSNYQTSGLNNYGVSYAAVVRNGVAAPVQRSPLQPARQFHTQHVAPQQQQYIPGPTSQPGSQMPIFDSEIAAAARSPMSSPHTKTYAEAVRSRPPTLDSQTWNWLESLDHPLVDNEMTDLGDAGQIGGETQLEAYPRSQPFTNTIMNNVNFQPGIAESSQNVESWVARPRVPRDRLVPRLDTTRLAPPTPSTHRSPVSAASPSSSRMSNRRTKQQLIRGNYDHRCHVCQAGFDTRSDLTHHLRSHAPYSQRQHVCAFCNKRFPYAKDLRRHLRIHGENKILCPHASCKFAWKGFARQDHLDRHLRSQHPVDSVWQSPATPVSGGF